MDRAIKVVVKRSNKKKVDKYPSYTTVGRIVTVWNSLTEAQF